MSIFRNSEMKLSMGIFIFLTAFTASLALFFDVKISIGVIISGVILSFTFYIVSYFRYKRIKNLSAYIDDVLHFSAPLTISKAKEGELAVLVDEIEKMLLALSEKNELLQKEREFLSNSMADISHQLRTPLTSINIIITLLQEDEVEKEKRFELVKELNKLIKRIDDLVTSLLKLSKIDAGTIEFEKREVKVRDLLKQAIVPLEVAMDIREQKLSVSCGDETFKGDISWTAEAVGNIFKNCSDYAGVGGEIKVTVSESPIFTQILIEDNGKGFDSEDIPHLFERFYKGKNSSKDSFGIGLALARSIIVGQNGSIKAENAQDGGAVFSVKFYK